MSAPARSASAASRIDAALTYCGLWLTYIAAAAVAAIFVLVTAAVVMRYVVSEPFRFTEELSGLMLAMSVFFVMPLTVAGNLNIRITLLSDRLGGIAARALWIFAELILVAFFAVFAWEAWTFYGAALRFNERSEQAQLVLAPWKLATAIVFAFCALIAAWRAIRPKPQGGGTAI